MTMGEEENDAMSDSKDKTEWAHPVDKGWAWLVMLGSFGVHLMSVGYMRSVGILILEFQDTSSSVTSVINGCQFLSYSTLTLFAMNYLVHRLSVRTCCQIGCTLQFFSIATSGFVPSTLYVIFTQGILYGFGQALLHCPSLFILSQYFERRRPIATSIATCGASVGGVIFPLLTRHLIDVFELRGALILLSSLMLHQLAFTAVFTPPSEYWFDENHSNVSKSDIKKKSILEDGSNGTETHTSDFKTSSKQDNLNELGNLQREESKSQNFEKRTSDSNNIYPTRSIVQRNALTVQLPGLEYVSRSSHHIPSTDQKGSAASLNSVNREDKILALSLQLLPTAPYTSPSLEHPTIRQFKLSSNNMVDALRSYSFEQLQASLTSVILGDSTREKQHNHHKQSESLFPMPTKEKNCHHNYIIKEQQIHNDNCEQTDHLVSSSADANPKCYKEENSSCSSNMNFHRWYHSFTSVLKIPSFWILAVYFSCGAVGTVAPPVFVPQLTKERGLSANDGAFFLMISAAVDSFGRLVPGLILHFQIVRASTLMLVPLICCGLTYNLTPFFTDFNSLLALSLIYGFLTSSYWALQTLIVIEILGFDMLASSIGFFPFFMGLATSVSFPLCGALRDMSGTFTSVFHYLGAMYMTAAGSLLFLRFFNRHKNSSITSKINDMESYFFSLYIFLC